MRRAIAGMSVLLLTVAAGVQAEALRIEGSTTVGPLADAFAQYFKSVQPDLSITVNQTGSNDYMTSFGPGIVFATSGRGAAFVWARTIGAKSARARFSKLTKRMALTLTGSRRIGFSRNRRAVYHAA